MHLMNQAIEEFTNQMGHVNGMTGMKKVLFRPFLRSVLACLFLYHHTFKFVEGFETF